MQKSKIIFLLVFGFLFSSNHLSVKDNFTLVHSEEDFSSIVFESHDIELDNKNGKSKFITNDLIGLTMDEGKPQLPVYSTLFQINPNKTYEVDYEVLESYVLDNIELENYKTDNGEFYSVYPEENIYVSEPQVMRGIVLNQIGITPYKYSSDTKTLEVYKSVKINIKETGDSTFEYFEPEKKSRVFEEFYQSSVINYRTLIKLFKNS